MAAQPLPIPGQSWPVLPPGASFAKGLPAVDWPTGPAPDPSLPLSQHQTRPDPALADPLDPAIARGLVPLVNPPAAPASTVATQGLSHYLVLGLRQTARGLARAWKLACPAAPAPAPIPPGLGAGAANPEPKPGNTGGDMATNADHLAARPINWAELSWLRLPRLAIRAVPAAEGSVDSLPDPCLADPLRPESWRPLVATRSQGQDEAQAPSALKRSSTTRPTALLCRVGHA